MNGISFVNSNVLRGIAIIFVIACHVIGKFGHAPGTILGAIGVSIFFLLSGYGLQESFEKKGRKDFWIKKIKRVWIPYVCLTVPFMVVDKVSWITIFGDLTLSFPYYYYGWYLRALFVFYLCFYLSTWIKNSNYLTIFWILFILGIYAFFHDIGKINGLAFVIGIYISLNKTFLKDKRQQMLIASIAGIIIAIASYLFISANDNTWLIRCQIIQICISCSIVFFICSMKLNYRILLWIGSFSYELYIIHGWFIAPRDGLDLKTCLWLLPLVFASSFLYAKSFGLLWNKLSLNHESENKQINHK